MATYKSKYGIRDGFLVRGEEFLVPNDLHGLDPKTQYDLEICTLFINEKLTIPDIALLTGDDYGTIVQALLSQKVIVDRRQKPRPPKPVASGN
jgi:hypothetical protein